jgi:hypothetical protein
MQIPHPYAETVILFSYVSFYKRIVTLDLP